ncbi:unnamed protein product [Didymodactylos carnosus]|nr:unnamed protein product [Didymodactylos carnosus]CAF4050820.1 unnamed protein product [Didymodactylos carnosus]
MKKENWQLHPPLFPELHWSKSGTLLIHNDTHRFLFFNESNIEVAVTQDLIHYEYTGKTFLQIRPNYFDSELVEPGPEPRKISDGNYLFLYNSGRQVSTPNSKPNWHREYNVGWAIMDKNDPMNILARSDEPILSPVLDWEKCDNNSDKWSDLGLTPLVVFVEGWKQIAHDEFIVWYQGCDSVTGVAKLTIKFDT